MIYWFTGQPSSGKTALATLLVSYPKKSTKVKHIDGDCLRELTKNTPGRIGIKIKYKD